MHLGQALNVGVLDWRGGRYILERDAWLVWRPGSKTYLGRQRAVRERDASMHQSWLAVAVQFNFQGNQRRRTTFLHPADQEPLIDIA